MKNFLRFFFISIGGFLVVFIVFSYLRVTKERAVLMDDLDRRARVIANTLGTAAARILQNPPALAEEDIAKRLSGQGRTMGVVLCDMSGNVVARTAGLTDLKECDDPDIASILQGSGEKILLQEQKGRFLHELSVPITDRAGTMIGALTIVHDASYIRERVMSALTWTTLTLAALALFISAMTYWLSRRSFQRSVGQLRDWIKSSSSREESEKQLPPPPQILGPVTRELEKLTAHLRSARETAQEISRDQQVSDLWTPSRLKSHAVAHFSNRLLIAVSNREPFMHVKEHGRRKLLIPASGLVTSLDPVLRATSGLWIAHGAGDADRETVDRDGKMLVPPDRPSYTLKRVWLTKEEEEGYYYGFSNEALWPLCHMSHHRPIFEESDWDSYVHANRKFADAVVQECGADRPFVLVQDYHFTLLSRFLREKRPDAVIGLFWHIPWPTLEAFQICPWKREILEGMLGANFIGFHLQSYCNNFLDTVNGLLPVRIDWDRSAVLHEHGSTVVKPFPISIQPWSERNLLSEQDYKSRVRAYREELELGKTRIVVSVDRLDYTKGIPERLGAIDLFFEKNPSHRGKVSFVQLCSPSRIHIPRYRELVKEVEETVDRVNWKHGSEGWKPVVFLKANHEPVAVYTFLRMADACIVSSLADGMNLVAKEYVSARESADGVLILSEFAGVSRDFEEALQFNPYSRVGFAEAIRVGLEMPLEEQRRRMTRLKAQVTENNVYRWAADLITEMARAGETQATAETPTAANSSKSS